MENPFEVLGVKTDKKFDEVLEFLEQQLQTLKKSHKIYANIFERYKNPGFKYVTSAAIRKEAEDDILDFLNERFVLGIVADKKHFTQEDTDKICETIEIRLEQMKEYLRKKEELSSKNENQSEEISTEELPVMFIDQDFSKRLFSSIMTHSRNTLVEANLLEKYLTEYKNDSTNNNAREALEDLYIKAQFEEAVCKLATQLQTELQPELQVAEKVNGNYEFKMLLENNPKYQRLLDAYTKIATADARNDLIPELYIMSRVSEPNRIGHISDRRADAIVRKEQEYQDEYLRSLTDAFNGKSSKTAAINSNHDFAWGIILTNPQYIMKNELVNTPIYKGIMSVEHLGAFTEETFFRKVKMVKKETSERRAHTNIRGPKKSWLEEKIDAILRPVRDLDDSPKSIREYYYKHKATLTLYDNIYRVTKRDVDGKTTTNIVFSPIGVRDFDDDDTKSFIKNIYFSDYMLDIARRNGGYAGEIYPSKDGFVIDTKTMSEKIGAAILFSRGKEGTIFDTRGANEKSSRTQIQDVILSSKQTLAVAPVSDTVVKHRNATNKLFERLLKGKEKERAHNE